MTIAAIGDIHGIIGWKDALKESGADRFVFIGDYFDSRDGIPPHIQVKNFREILALKREYPEQFVLLLGNHDYHYLRVSDDRYSGHNAILAPDAYEVLRDAVVSGDLQACCAIGDWLFSHAGVTKTWCADNDIDTDNIEASINELFRDRPRAFAFTLGVTASPYGDDVCQTPIWVRPNSLLADAIDGFRQVVGHTQKKEIEITEKAVFIDALGQGWYLIIKDGEPTARRLKMDNYIWGAVNDKD